MLQVSCGSRVCCGSGPNKRLAKRAAAEAMLAEIGYVKPLPPPGKSLLKKKMDSQLNIGILALFFVTMQYTFPSFAGVFDPSDLVTPPVPNNAGVSLNDQVEQQESHGNDEQAIQEGLLYD